MICVRQFVAEWPRSHPRQCCACRRRNPLPNVHQSVKVAEVEVLRILTAVGGIKAHLLEAIVAFQDRAGPLPDAPHAAVSAKGMTIASDWNWGPVLESHIATLEIDKQLMRTDGIHRAINGASRQTASWWCNLNPVIGQVTLSVSAQLKRGIPMYTVGD